MYSWCVQKFPTPSFFKTWLNTVINCLKKNKKKAMIETFAKYYIPNKHDWVGKVIHWELCKKKKFDHTSKWYIHKPESVLENEIYKILLDFEHKGKIKDFARELRKLWNMRLTVIPVIIGTLGMVHKGLERGLENLEISGQVETFQTIALLKLPKILRRDQGIWRDLLSLGLCERPSANTGVKNLQWV